MALLPGGKATGRHPDRSAVSTRTVTREALTFAKPVFTA